MFWLAPRPLRKTLTLESRLEDIKNSALILLARREHGYYELKQKLLRKGYENEHVEHVLHSLVLNGLQSDYRFVESYVQRRARKGFGPKHIAHELRKKQISNELISKIMSLSDNNWYEEIKRIWQKKFGQKVFSQEVIKSKQIYFLQSRGFDLAQIKKFFDEKFDESNE